MKHSFKGRDNGKRIGLFYIQEESNFLNETKVQIFDSRGIVQQFLPSMNKCFPIVLYVKVGGHNRVKLRLGKIFIDSIGRKKPLLRFLNRRARMNAFKKTNLRDLKNFSHSQTG